MMRRRFCAATLAMAALPLMAQSSQRRVAIIGIGDLSRHPLSSLIDGLWELGYERGRNLDVLPPISRGAYEALLPRALAAAEWHAEVMVALGDTATRAAKNATASIPIVMTTGTDPAQRGYVKNLARPEGNITGFTTANQQIAVKRIELLREIAPKMRRLGILWGRGSANQAETVKIAETMAARGGASVHSVELKDADAITGALESLASARVDALFYVNSALFGARYPDIVHWAAAQKVPVVYTDSSLARMGGLASYGWNAPALYRRVAMYVDRILKGAKPAELPVEQPTKLEVVINLKTAQASGIRIPQSALLRADEVIQ
jgi:ABC-type uncharacterized transport system substrate-binding protein